MVIETLMVIATLIQIISAAVSGYRLLEERQAARQRREDQISPLPDEQPVAPEDWIFQPGGTALYCGRR